MSIAAETVARSYTYEDLAHFPDDHLRREIIDGELIVSPSPIVGHQQAVGNILFRMENYRRSTGGRAYTAPLDVFFADNNVVEPDVLFIRADHLERVEIKFIRNAPDVVVEVSSPSTRRLELVRKLELYQRFGVPEYWCIDLEAERVEVYVLADGLYGVPQLLFPGDELHSTQLAGFTMPVAEALGNDPENLPQG